MIHKTINKKECSIESSTSLPDEPMQGVRHGDPADEAAVGGQGDDGEPLDGQVAPRQSG